jgi:capsular polysaccharide biosynthesis protein
MNKKFLIVIPVAFIVIIAAIVFSFSFINDNNNNIPQSIVKSNDQDSNKEEGTTINSQILE